MFSLGCVSVSLSLGGELMDEVRAALVQTPVVRLDGGGFLTPMCHCQSEAECEEMRDGATDRVDQIGRVACLNLI